MTTLRMYEWRIDFHDPFYVNPIQSRYFHELQMRHETMLELARDFVNLGFENVVLWELAPDATEYQQINLEVQP